MKSFKNILVYLFLFLSISIYWGQDIIDFINHFNKIEYAANIADSKSLVSSESSFEEDIPSIVPKNSADIKNQGCERFGSFISSLPSNVNFSVWLPPEIS